MKRVILILTLLTTSIVYAGVSWNPSIGVNASYSATDFSKALDRTESIWSSTFLEAEANPLAMKINHHEFSLPFSIGYRPSSDINDRMQMADSFTASLSLRYGFHISEKFLIEGGAGVRYRWYHKASGGSWSIGGNLSALFFPLDFMAISIPLTLYYGGNALDFTAGIGLRFVLGGGK